MTRLLETPGSSPRNDEIAAPLGGGTETTGLSVLARIARIFYAVLSSFLVVAVLTQVFFAGMGAFGADWSWHLTFVHLLEPLPLLLIPVAFVGRLPWSLRLLPLVLLFLIGAQYAFANVAMPAAALHPVNAVLIFLTGLFISRRAWTVVSGQSKR